MEGMADQASQAVRVRTSGASVGFTEQPIFAIQIITAVIIVTLSVPLLLSPFSFWDGRILDYALATGQEAGVRVWFTTSGWHLQYAIFAMVQRLADATGLSGLFMLRLISVISVVGITWETMRFGQNVAGFSRGWSAAMGAAAAAFPTWNTLLSEVLFIYVLCTWLLLLGSRLFFTSNGVTALVGLTALICSLQLNSNFMFSLFLALGYAAFAWHSGQLTRSLTTKVVFVGAAVVSAFLLLRFLYHPSGEYADYNSFTPRLFGPFYLIVETARYFQYAAAAGVLIFVGLAIEALPFWQAGDRAVRTGARTYAALRKDLWPLAISIVMIAGAVFPYIAVGKPADLRLPGEWDLRNTMPMVMPLALFAVSLARLLARLAPPRSVLVCAVPILTVVAGFWAAQQALLWGKLGRAAFEQGTVQALRTLPPPAPGVIFVDAPQLPRPALRYYETNWLLNKAYGREDWLVHQLPIKPASVYPEWMTAHTTEAVRNRSIYRSTYMMRTFVNRCRTALRVDGPRYSFSRTIGWVFGATLPTSLRVQQIGQRCAITSP